MDVTIKKPFKLKHLDGSIQECRPGDRLTLEKSKIVERLFDGGFIELSMTKGRRRTLEKCMDATMFEAMREIQTNGYWKVKQIEKEVHETYQAVLEGLKKLSDYRAQVERWQKAGTVH